MVMLSGLPSEAACQDVGMPFSLAMVSSDMARTSEETPMMAKIKKDAQAIVREMMHKRFFMSFCWAFFID